MIPTAVSEIVEAVCKVIFGPTLASLAINYCMDEYNKEPLLRLYHIKCAFVFRIYSGRRFGKRG